MSVGDVIDELGGHQRFHETDHGHGQGIRRDDLQGLQRPRHVRNKQGR